jgi:hypothetical protein
MCRRVVRWGFRELTRISAQSVHRNCAHPSVFGVVVDVVEA